MGVNKRMISICEEYLSEEENIFMIYINTNVVDKYTNKSKKYGLSGSFFVFRYSST